jgi:hypothetical protein
VIDLVEPPDGTAIERQTIEEIFRAGEIHGSKFKCLPAAHTDVCRLEDEVTEAEQSREDVRVD